MSLELIRWRDAVFSLTDEFDDDGDEPFDYVVELVGWATLNGRWLHVESEHLPGNDGVRCVTRIPIENVVERVPLTGRWATNG